jgi:ribonuclease PH
LRSVVDLTLLGERQVIIDCDVLEADGGTRTASITGSYVALCLATESLVKEGKIKVSPIVNQVAAISCGIYKGTPVLDLDYDEDSSASMDANFVLTSDGRIIEIQCTAEESPVEESAFHELLKLARGGIVTLCEAQKKALNA